MKEDWQLLKEFFPAEWRDLALQSEALKGLRQDKDEEILLRMVLLHVGCGFSLRETTARASMAGWANLSDVALLKRLRKSEKWLLRLCQALFRERAIAEPMGEVGGLRLIDATEVSEPGKTGSLWRLHYSVRIPSLECSCFELTPARGVGTGETLKRFKAHPGEHLLADRGYSTGASIFHIARQGADLTVRLCPSNVRLQGREGREFNLIEELEGMSQEAKLGDWDVVLLDRTQTCRTEGRVCALRKSHAAAMKAQKKLRRRAQKNGQELDESTLLYAQFVIVFTTRPRADLGVLEVLDLYRYRWQVELVFKRFKQIAKLGHLPKHDPASARAWLYGKLFVALTTEKLLAHAERLSPWGYPICSNRTHT